MRVRVQYVRRRRVMVFNYGKEFFNEFEIKDSSSLRWRLMRVLISAFSKITDLVSSRVIELEIEDDATFLEFFFGRKTFPWHGGSPYIWVKIMRRRNGSLYASVKVLVNMFLPMYSNTELETAKKLLAKFQKFYKFT